MQYVNKNLIMMYFRIGKILDENSKYGNSFIENIANAIKIEYPNIKGFSNRNLKYMKKFYIEYKDNEKMQQLVAQLPWGHNILLMEKIKNVLLEFGTGFSFVGSQYKLVVGDNEYFIDLLFYHTKLKCYIVVELKATEFKPEYIGKMNFYLSAVDDLIKDKNDNPSIGLILCKNKDKFIAQYSLKDVNKPIGISSFKLKEYLPSEEDLNMYIDLEND